MRFESTPLLSIIEQIKTTGGNKPHHLKAQKPLDKLPQNPDTPGFTACPKISTISNAHQRDLF